MKLITMIVLLLAMMTGCSNKEQLYEGLYKGLGTLEQSRQTENPSYGPLKAAEQEQLEYHAYKIERQKSLGTNEPVNNEAK